MNDSYEGFDSINDAYIDSAYDGDSAFDESARARAFARRRARARAMNTVRRGLQAAKRLPARNVQDAFNRVGSDIQKVDMESKVNSDLLESLLKLQGSRITGVESSSALSKVWDELKEQFPSLSANPVLKTLLPFAPLLFLKPEKKGSGLESMLRDPRFWGPALAGALALFNSYSNKKPEAKEIKIKPIAYTFPKNTANQAFDLLYTVYDSAGKVMNADVEWNSTNEGSAKVDQKGRVTSVAANTVTWISATVRGTNVKDVIEVKVPA